MKNDHRSKFQFKQLEGRSQKNIRASMGRYELNKLTALSLCGFIAQLVEHRTGIAEVTGSNPVEALISFRPIPSNCLNWKIYCDDHFMINKAIKCCSFYVIFYFPHVDV